MAADEWNFYVDVDTGFHWTHYPDDSDTTKFVSFVGTGGKFGFNVCKFFGQSYLKIRTSDQAKRWQISQSDFTLDFWIQFSQINTLRQYVFSSTTNNSFEVSMTMSMIKVGNNQSGHVTWYHSFSKDQWYHIALVRSSGIISCFINGEKQDDDFSYNYNLDKIPDILGGNFDGNNYFLSGIVDEVRWSDNARWTKNFSPPTSEYLLDDHTKLICTFESTTIVSRQSTSFAKEQIYTENLTGTTWYREGGTSRLDFSTRHFGLGSFFLDGSTPVYTSKTINFGKNFSIDFWLYLSDDKDMSVIFDVDQGPWLILYQNKLYFGIGDSFDSYLNFGEELTILQWYHIAVTYNRSVINLYIDGSPTSRIETGSFSIPSALWCNRIYIGCKPLRSYFGYSCHTFNGFIDEFRISNEVRWGNSFNAPTEQYLLDGFTEILLHFNSLDQDAPVDVKERISYAMGSLKTKPYTDTYSVIKKLVITGDDLVVNDSLTDRSLLRSGFQHWTSIVARECLIEMVNSGEAGLTISNLRNNISSYITNHNPSHVIICAGYNDYGGSGNLNSINTSIAFCISDICSDLKAKNITPIMLYVPAAFHEGTQYNFSGTVMRANETNVSLYSGLRDSIIEAKEDNICDAIVCDNTGLGIFPNINEEMYAPDGLKLSQQGEWLLARYVIEHIFNYYWRAGLTDEYVPQYDLQNIVINDAAHSPISFLYKGRRWQLVRANSVSPDYAVALPLEGGVM